jgi:hypothetical protein
MFTNKRFPIVPPKDIGDLWRVLSEYFLSLEQKDALAIVQTATWTPTITTGTGTITTSSASGGYHTIGDLTFFRVQISITTNGTGATSVKFTLPTAATQTYVFSGRESTVGRQLQGIVSASSNVVTVLDYDNTYPGANGNVLHIAGFYH